MNDSLRLDVLISGGGLAAVSAAVTLRSAGKSVALVTHRTFLGEDLCDSLRLQLPADLDLSHPLADRLYGDAFRSGATLRPMHLKRELDRICEAFDIPVLLGTQLGELTVSEDGCTAVLHNRSGRRTVTADRLIDGTLRGELARQAGVPLTAPDSEFEVLRRVIGGEAAEGREDAWTEEGRVTFASDDTEVTEPLWVHRSTGSLADGSWAAWADLEQRTRIDAYRFGQSMSADGIFALTGERLHPDQSPFDAQGDVASIPAGAVSACGGRLWCAGPAANVDPATREALIRPDVALRHGDRVAAFCLQSELETTAAFSVSIEQTVDVLVVGGGTGGAPAGIGAARAGADTLVVETLSGLGGVGTLGMIGRYWFGNRVGFTAEVDAGADALTNRPTHQDGWDVEAKMQWYHRELTAAGGRVWYKSGILKVLHHDGQVTGAVIGTPQGPVTVHAGCVVDATGAAVVAAGAGADTVSIGQGNLAVQGTGLPGRDPGKDYRNTDYDFIDDTDADDLASAHVTAREKFKTAFDAGQLVDSRERRRIVGDYEVSPMDIRLRRVFPDSVVLARSNFDTHGYTLHPLFMIVPPDHDPREGFIPLRALLARGLEGVITTGLGISAHRDAMPVIRMQADVQNQGYAAGVIAAMAARDTGGRIRNLELDAIQAHLVEVGILDPDIRGAADSFPLSDDEIDRALAGSLEEPDLLDRVFTLPDAERDARLRQAFQQAEDVDTRRHFAFILGILGDASGVDTLARDVAERDWDKGWNYTGMGQFGASMSPLDARLIALGRCRDRRHLPVLLEKADTLPVDAEFSHYRALAEALRTLGDPSGALVLADLLERPGLSGHHMHTVRDRLRTAETGWTDTAVRNAVLIELHLATALHRLNPNHPAARKILDAYRTDIRALFASHAKAVLAENPSAPV